MKKMAMLSFLVLAVCVMPMVAAAVPSLPGDLSMVAPDSSLPKELTDFWGKWKGIVFPVMGAAYDIFIIVEKIDEKKASIWLWSTKTDKWERKDADVIKDGEYKLEFLGGSTNTRKELSLRKGKMILSSPLSAGVSTATLKRVT